MPLPEPLAELLALARRRLWVSRLVGEGTLGLGIGAAGAAAVWGVSQVVVFQWADRVAWALLVAAVAGALGWWVSHRPTAAQAALWADHRLGGADRLSTAWELSRRPQVGRSGIRQIQAAGEWAAGVDTERLAGEYPSGRTVALSVLTVASALLLAISPSLTDQALIEIREVREVVDREVETIEDLAFQAPEGLSERLTNLAERLGETQTLEEALSELSSARLELEERLGPNRLAENTALAGLASRLSRHPVAQGEDPAAQLADLASSFGGMSEAQRQTVAQELADRATDFAGVNEELASALAEAASALAGQGLDPGLVADALERAAEQISSAQAGAAQQAAAAAAAAQLAEAEGRLRGAREGRSQPGAGRGGGEGAGRGEGQGQGQGQGGGEGAGQGQGQGAGSGIGGGGQTDRFGVGAGSLSGDGDNDPAADPRYSSSFFEPPSGGLGEEVRVPIEGGDPGEVAGRSTAPSVANAALVPYVERFAEYRTAALESLERRPLPSHLTDVVQSYFTELEP